VAIRPARQSVAAFNDIAEKLAKWSCPDRYASTSA